MSNYSHRGYEHRTGGYGRRRRKASGFRRKNTGKTAVKAAAASAAAIAAVALVYLFADNIMPFVSSLRQAAPAETSDLPDRTIAVQPSSPDEGEIAEAKGEFDIVDKVVFISGGSGYLRFKGINTTARNYAAILNSISSSMSGSVSVYSAVIPTNAEVGLEGAVPGSYSQSDNLAVIESSLSDRVISVDIFSALSAHKSEYIYYRTDPCLTPLGGYYAYRQIAESAHFDSKSVYSVSELSKKSGVIARYEGDYLARTTDSHIQPHGNQTLFDNADVIEYFKLPVHYNCYAVDPKTGGRTETDLFSERYAADDPTKLFPGRNTALMYIENLETKTDKRLLIIKDHDAEPVIGYLVPEYSEVHTVDAALYRGDMVRYMNEHEITDVMFISGIDDANNSLYCQRMRDLFDNSISD